MLTCAFVKLKPILYDTHIIRKVQVNFLQNLLNIEVGSTIIFYKPFKDI